MSDASTTRTPPVDDEEDGAASPKRARREEPVAGPVSDEKFTLTFESTNPLRTLVDVVHNILTRIEFQVIKDDLFEGIQLESIDTKQICLIVAKLACKVTGPAGARFCVDAGTFNTCLKSVSPHYSVDVSNELDCTLLHKLDDAAGKIISVLFQEVRGVVLHHCREVSDSESWVPT